MKDISDSWAMIVSNPAPGPREAKSREYFIDYGIYPDFTVRHPITGERMYWEHFGRMDDPEYREGACKKIKLYCDNGIIPSISLIATFETSDHPLDVERVEKIIKEFFC